MASNPMGANALFSDTSTLDIMALRTLATLAFDTLALDTPPLEMLDSDTEYRTSAEVDLFDLENQDAARDGLPTDVISLVQSQANAQQSFIREALLVAVLCMAQFTTQAGLGQTISSLHIIGNSFDTRNPGQLSWFASAYSLTVGTFILIAGRLGDVFGHKRLLIAGFFWFATWSLIAGFSVYSSMIFFDFCRAMQGIGPAFCLPNAIAIIGRTYPPGRKQEMLFSIFGACAPVGAIFGMTFSAIFAELLWWPWAFWAMAIFCLIIAIAACFIIPYSPAALHDSSVNIWIRIDALGSAFGVIGLVLVNFAWNQGPVAGWGITYVYVLLIVGFLFLGVFGFVESRARYPLLPSEIFNSQTGFVLACISLGWASFGIWMYYIWLILQDLRDVSPLLACGQFAPVAISGTCAALTTGVILSRVTPSSVMLVAMMAFCTGNILVATMPIDQTYWAQTFLSIIITPWGMDMSFPAATILLSNRMPQEHQGLAASLVNTAINYSISIGLGIAGTVETQVFNGGRNRADVLKGFHGALYVGIGLSGMGIIVAFLFGLTERRNAMTEKPSV
ncbi:Drug resistance protein [Phlyctema vagabunda]|uniref:Drug resistance protein n=1 Tax=Phlyctema vagabunda TaxID=108571 RepID=A0ABR4PL83_9HELO